MDFALLPAHWLILGAILAASEIFIPGFVIIFFGAGAILTGLTSILFSQISWTVSLILFLIYSILSLVVFRRYCVSNVRKESKSEVVSNPDDAVIGAFAIAISDISPESEGKVELHGTNWNASSETPIAKGTRVEVVSRRGLQLFVRSAK